MKKNFIVLLFIIFFTNSAFAFKTKAKYAIVLDYNNFKVLYQTSNATDITAPSSMTKMMTGYIIFDLIKSEKLSLTDKFKVSIKAWRQEGARTFLEPEKYVSLDNLLKGMLIQSGNDAAVALAEGSYENIDNFVEQMNRKAKELGMVETHFMNPNGLFHKNHYMSVYDTMILSYNLIKNHKNFYDKYFSMKSFEYNGIKQNNRNWLLNEYTGTDGIKTGYTGEGGYSLASSVYRHGQRIIVVVNGTKTERERIEESKKLFEQAFELYQYIELYKKNEIITTLEVKNGDKNFVNIYTNEDIVYSTKKENMANLKVQLIYSNNLTAPIKEDQILGYIQVTDGEKITKFPLLAKNEVNNFTFMNKFKQIFKK